MEITVKDLAGIFPRSLENEERTRAENLIQAALDLIEEAFLRAGRDFYKEVENSRLLRLTVKRIVLAMVSEAVLVGEHVGRASASSTTGPQSDSITFSQGVGIHWGGVHLTDEWLRALGLGTGSGLGFVFPELKRYAEPVAYRNSRFGAEFSERTR